MAATKRRKFTSIDKDGKTIELAIKKPNQMVLNEADLHYNVSINRAIRMGSMTKIEATEMIKERKLWTDKDNDKIDQMRKEIVQKERQLANKGVTKSRGLLVAKELKELRANLVSYLGKRNAYLTNTAEYYAENIKDQFIAASCTVVADTDELYFDDFDNYLERSDEVASSDAYREVVYMLNGYDVMEHNNLAENKYLLENGGMTKDGFFVDDKGRKVTSTGKLIDDDYNFINEDGQIVDEFGNRINKDGSPIFEEEVKALDTSKEAEPEKTEETVSEVCLEDESDPKSKRGRPKKQA